VEDITAKFGSVPELPILTTDGKDRGTICRFALLYQCGRVVAQERGVQERGVSSPYKGFPNISRSGCRHVFCISLRIELPDVRTACETTNGHVEHYCYWARTLMKDAGGDPHSFLGPKRLPWGTLQVFLHTVKPLLHQ
jgi:hypothetical protein